MASVSFADIEAAAERIKPHIHRTPVMKSDFLNRKAGCVVFFKCENFQKVGAFKARGACNAVFSLTPQQAERGVVTHSSGNHGAALAWAAGKRGISATVVVPENAPGPKKRAIEGFGAKIVFCAPTVQARESTTNDLIARHGFELVHPYDDDRVIAGQGTAAKELIEEMGELDIVMAPTGGGGLLSGTSITAKHLLPSAKVIGGEPEGADDAYRSFTTGVLVTEQTPKTICDGLRTTLSPRTLAIIRANVDAIHTAEEATILRAMRMIWETMKIIVEPSCCPPLAAILENPAEFRDKRVGIILTGGNVDLEKLPWQS
jgi:threonine dehydratase